MTGKQRQTTLAANKLYLGFLFLLLQWLQATDATKIADIDKPIPISTVKIVAGHTARLECDLHSGKPEDSAYLVLWYITSEKQPIYSVDLRARPLEQAKHWKNERLSLRAHFETSSGSTAALLLANVNEDDTNEYRCRVDFRHSPTRQVRYQLKVIQLPKSPVIYVNDERQVGNTAGPYDEGSDLLLICEVLGGGSDFAVGWYRNGKLLESNSTHHRMPDDSIYPLQLKGLSRSDHRTTYSCQLDLDTQPPVAPVARNISLNLRMKPATVEIILVNSVLEAAKNQQLQCKATGAYPTALITWWIGTKQLVDVEITVSDEVNGTISTLDLIPSMEDDGRIVTCRAETPHLPAGVVEDSWRMQVHYPPRANLVLGRRFTADEIREGSDIYLECHVRANPSFQRLTWMHNGKSLHDDRSRGIFISNQTLVIRHIGRNTAGNYTCIAANRQGESSSLPLNLQIKYAPICQRSKPLMVVASPEQPTLLRCQVDADPGVVSFRWTLSTGRETALVPREVPLDDGLSSVLEYTPRRDADFGQLQCWAKNEIGKQQEPCVFNIIKEGLPPTPTQCVMHNLFKAVLEIKCRNVSTGMKKLLDGGDYDDDDVSMSGSSNVYWLQLYNADTGYLLRNMSNKAAPQFNVTGIDPSTRVAAVITTTNRQGRSEAVSLEGAVERAVGSRAVNNEPAESSTTMVVVLVAPGALLIVIVTLAAILALYHRRKKREQRRSSSQDRGMPATNENSNHPDSGQPMNCNHKPPDLIKPKEVSGSSNFDYQVTSPLRREEPSVAHSSIVVVTGSSSNNGVGLCQLFNEGNATAHAMHKVAVSSDATHPKSHTVKNDRRVRNVCSSISTFT